MKYYDFEKIKQFIEQHKNIIETASLGFNEDWFWTAETVFENGEFSKQLNEETKIAGINGSMWATPTMEIVYTDGTEEKIECSKGEFSIDNITERIEREMLVTSGLGCLSKPSQELRGEIDRKI